MNELQLDLPLILPVIDERDQCIRLLTDRLAAIKGIKQAHIIRNNGTAQLCLHYDPNLLPMRAVKRLAQDAGVQITDRYRHEQIPLGVMDVADAAPVLADVLEKLPGMLHASVNYAAGLAFVAYDNQVLQRPAIEQAIRSMGYRVATTQGEHADEEHDEHVGHDHGSAPAFLPHWMQERWTLLLVGLAGVFFLTGWIGETFASMSPAIALIFYILAYIAGGYDIATHALPGLLKGKFDTDVLMLAAATGAAILGEWAEGAFLLFLFALGHAGEHYALDRARNAVNALGELMPKTARVKRGGQIVEEPVESLQVDDIVVVRPGDRLPVDGMVVSGSSAIDQSPITGESAPIQKESGDEVFAGTINQEAALDIQVTKLARDNTLSRVMQMVAEAQRQQIQILGRAHERHQFDAVDVNAHLLLVDYHAIDGSGYTALPACVAPVESSVAARHGDLLAQSVLRPADHTFDRSLQEEYQARQACAAQQCRAQQGQRVRALRGATGVEKAAPRGGNRGTRIQLPDIEQRKGCVDQHQAGQQTHHQQQHSPNNTSIAWLHCRLLTRQEFQAPGLIRLAHAVRGAPSVVQQ